MTYRTFALLILSVLLVAPAPAAEPTYRGRTAQQWVAALRSRSFRERALARMTFDRQRFEGKLRLDDRAAADLVDALGDRSWEVRELAEEVLKSQTALEMFEIRLSPPVIAALLRQLAGPTDARLAAAGALSRLVQAEPFDERVRFDRIPRSLTVTLADWSTSHDPARRAGAASAWARLSRTLIDADGFQMERVYVGPLIRSLRDPDVHVRLAAVAAMTETTLPDEAVPALIDAMFDPNPELRRAAGELIDRLADDAVVPLLSPRLSSKDAGTRRLAARLMLAASKAATFRGASGPALPPSAIAELVSDPDPKVRAGATALLPHSPQNVARLGRWLKEDPSAEVRAGSASALASLVYDEAGVARVDAGVERALRAALRTDPSPLVRAAIAGRMPVHDVEVLEIVARVRDDPTADQDAIDSLLYRGGGATSVATLLDALRSGSQTSRDRACRDLFWKCRSTPDVAAEDFAAHLIAPMEQGLSSPDRYSVATGR